MLNNVVLIGRLAGEVELKYTPQGHPVATCTIAVNRVPKPANGQDCDFINLVLWRQSAEFAANYLGKGRLVAIEGKLQIRSWVAQDGTRRKSAEVVVNNIRPLDKPKDTGDEGYDNGYTASDPLGQENEDPFA